MKNKNSAGALCGIMRWAWAGGLLLQEQTHSSSINLGALVMLWSFGHVISTLQFLPLSYVSKVFFPKKMGKMAREKR
jgi:hypothetical protein